MHTLQAAKAAMQVLTSHARLKYNTYSDGGVASRSSLSSPVVLSRELQRTCTLTRSRISPIARIHTSPKVKAAEE